MKIPLTNLVKYSPVFFNTMGEKIAKKVRIETKSGRSVEGKKFKSYSAGYKKRKKAGKFGRQSSTRVGVPDLTLTGDMLRALQTHGSSRTHVIVGWANPADASKVDWNEEEGRAITKDTGFPFSKGAEKIYDDMMLKDADKKVKAQKERIEFKIGK